MARSARTAVRSVATSLHPVRYVEWRYAPRGARRFDARAGATACRGRCLLETGAGTYTPAPMPTDFDRKRTGTLPLALSTLILAGLAAPLAAETSVSTPRDHRPLARDILQELVGIQTTESGAG